MKKWLLVWVCCMGLSVAGMAQCSVCTKTAAELDKKSARGLNSGVLYLAFIPLAIIGTVGFVWWKHNKPE